MTTADSYIALNRFGLGAKSGDLKKISTDPRAWVLSQMSSANLKQDYALPSSAELVEKFENIQKIKREKKDDKDALRDMRMDLKSLIMGALDTRFRFMVSTNTPLIERLVMFWGNVMTVSARTNPPLLPISVSFERDAIRPYIFERFEDMLIAATKHPAMLGYLNNAQSIGPNSHAGQRRGKGLNENLARETLELHSLGVNGGYTQDDVIALAKIITGWTIVNDKIKEREDGPQPLKVEESGFVFVPFMHEPGAQTLLGKVYNDNGLIQGELALRNLARHPATAKHMAQRLLVHFLSDTPSDQAVNHIADVFQRTDGNLAAVTKALITLPDMWAPQNSKVKTPYEVLIAQLRALNISADQLPFQAIYKALSDMDHVPMMAPSPAGWPDRTVDWTSGTAMMKRVEWAQAIAIRSGYTGNVPDLASDLFGGSLQPETLLALQRAPSQQDALTLLLTSPEMQRR